MKTKVLVVDDSTVMRKLFAEIINSAPDLEVVGEAPDAHAARELIKTLDPDVLTLDVQMPRMDGLEFLGRLMRLRPTRVVMVSAFTLAGSETTLRALELGAIDFVSKPRANNPAILKNYAEEVIEKIRAAAMAKLPSLVPASLPAVAVEKKMDSRVSSASAAPSVCVDQNIDRIVFVGASTGGTEALKSLLSEFPVDCPPTLVVQHMPEHFTASFAKRLDSLCAPRIIEAQGGERVERGMVFIAPGHSHLQIARQGGGYVIEIVCSPPVNRHRPSVDVLFDSAASVVGRRGVGVILTGMGKDGAQGLLRMRRAGARTFGQDEASSIVYGMPREAALIGAVEEAYGLGQLAQHVLATAVKSVA